MMHGTMLEIVCYSFLGENSSVDSTWNGNCVFAKENSSKI
jgi:hypothetical protein